MADQNRQVTARAPPEYNLKQCFTVWNKQFRNYCELLNINAANRYRTLLSFLDPESFIIVENLNLTNAQRADIFNNDTFRLIKGALAQRESNIPPGYALKYRKQKEGEKLEKYAQELEKLAYEAFPDDQNIRQNRTLIESFISGIRNDELAIKLLELEFDSLTDAVNRAVQFFQALQTRRFIKTESDFRPTMEKVYNITDSEPESNTVAKVSNIKNSTTFESQKPVDNAVTEPYPKFPTGQQPMNPFQFQWPNYTAYQYPYQLAQNPYNIPTAMAPFFGPNNMNNTQFRYPKKPQFQNQRQRNTNIICHFCQKRGHIKSECFSFLRLRSRATQPNNTTPLIKCTYCDKKGHVAANCWLLVGKPKNESEQAYNSKNPFRPGQ